MRVMRTRQQQMAEALEHLARAEPLLRGHHMAAYDNVTQAIVKLENALLLYQFKGEAT